MKNIKFFLSTIAIASLVLFAPSIISAKGHSGKSGKHGHSYDCYGDDGNSGKSGKSGKHGHHGHHGKSGKHGHHGKSGKSGGSGGSGECHENSCTPCKGGLSSITFRNDGSSQTVNITGKKGGQLFSEYIEFGEVFTYQSNGKMDNSIYINDAYIHTSCSKPLYAGMKVGEFTLVSAVSAKTGNTLCRLPEPSTGKVCGVVFYDKNNNGKQDDGEEGTKGIVVSVLDANEETKLGETRSTGFYCIDDVAVGEATVTVKESTLPANADLTVGTNPTDITVIGNKKNSAGRDGYIFPKPPVGKVCGVVFNDKNDNGKQDDTEKGTCGIVVSVKDSNNNVKTGKTTSTGFYCIDDVAVGEATVTVIESTLPAHASLTVGCNPNTVTVIENKKNSAGRDGYTLSCGGCSTCE